MRWDEEHWSAAKAEGGELCRWSVKEDAWSELRVQCI